MGFPQKKYKKLGFGEQHIQKVHTFAAFLIKQLIVLRFKK